MANNINWGLGILNNTINWGLGAVNNSISWGIMHADEISWSGETELYGVSFFIKNYNDRVIADGGIIESLRCVDENLDVVSNPIITLLGDVLALSRVDATYTDAGATAFDEFFFGDITSSIVTENNVNSIKAGVYDVKYNVTDLSGRAANQVVRTVYITSVLANRYDDRVLADGGTIENLQCVDFDYSVDWVAYLQDVDNYAKFISEYNSRVTLDGGTVESDYCISEEFYSQFDWMYYYRVLDDGGAVEKLECVDIVY